MPIRLAIVGFGKIAQDQHVPAIRNNADFDLVAIVSRDGEGLDGVPFCRDIAELIVSGQDIDAVSLCTPPQVRTDIARYCVEQGWHVLLEKPPGTKADEVGLLNNQAENLGVSLFASWHSRFAPGVEPARRWLAGRRIKNVRIIWREDVRVWHPGQSWIWQKGGFGVFDPGINSLSIVTRILPRSLAVESAELSVPGNLDAPIAAQVMLQDENGAPIEMELDFRQEGSQGWDIIVETDAGTLSLAQGGAVASVAGVSILPMGSVQPQDLEGEYPKLYRHFAGLVHSGKSDVDLIPLRLVEDALRYGKVKMVEDFFE